MWRFFLFDNLRTQTQMLSAHLAKLSKIHINQICSILQNAQNPLPQKGHFTHLSAT